MDCKPGSRCSHSCRRGDGRAEEGAFMQAHTHGGSAQAHRARGSRAGGGGEWSKGAGKEARSALTHPPWSGCFCQMQKTLLKSYCQKADQIRYLQKGRVHHEWVVDCKPGSRCSHSCRRGDGRAEEGAFMQAHTHGGSASMEIFGLQSLWPCAHHM